MRDLISRKEGAYEVNIGSGIVGTLWIFSAVTDFFSSFFWMIGYRATLFAAKTDVQFQEYEGQYEIGETA
jgi:hypothetical protein